MIKVLKGIDTELLRALARRDDVVYTARRCIFGGWRGVMILDIVGNMPITQHRIAQTKDRYSERHTAIYQIKTYIGDIINE